MPQRPAINEVFTPRATRVNTKMYVIRPEQEKELVRALGGSLHILVSGQSGSGKSWLYKKVLSESNSYWVPANCANASRLHSITDEIHHSVFPDGQTILTGYSEEKKASLKIPVAEGGLSHKNDFEVDRGERLMLAFEEINKRAKGRPPVLVLDNFETIYQDE